jgi:hypothetical protein
VFSTEEDLGYILETSQEKVLCCRASLTLFLESKRCRSKTFRTATVTGGEEITRVIFAEVQIVLIGGLLEFVG